MCVAWIGGLERDHPAAVTQSKEQRMAQAQDTPSFAPMEEAIIVLFCLIDDAYTHLNPRSRCYESLKRLSDSEILTLALVQQLRGVESERSFLRDAVRFFSHLRQRLSRFVRKSLSFSKSDRMHEICLRLFLHRYNLSHLL